MQFEWDDLKAASNKRKHGVSFTEAMTVFGDPLSLTAFGPDHSAEEDRFITIGNAAMGRLIVVSHTDRGSQIRIISARAATKTERKEYEDVYFP